MKHLIKKAHEQICIDLSEVAAIGQIKVKEEKGGTWYNYFEIAFKNKAALLVIVVHCDNSHYLYQLVINEEDYDALISKYSSL